MRSRKDKGRIIILLEDRSLVLVQCIGWTHWSSRDSAGECATRSSSDGGRTDDISSECAQRAPGSHRVHNGEMQHNYELSNRYQVRMLLIDARDENECLYVLYPFARYFPNPAASA